MANRIQVSGSRFFFSCGDHGSFLFGRMDGLVFRFTTWCIINDSSTKVQLFNVYVAQNSLILSVLPLREQAVFSQLPHVCVMLVFKAPNLKRSSNANSNGASSALKQCKMVK